MGIHKQKSDCLGRRNNEFMNEKSRKTPVPVNRIKVAPVKKEKKTSSFLQNLALIKFLDDVKEGDLDKFDVTTTSGFVKELLMRIKKVDVTGLGSQLAFFFLLSLFPLLIFLFTLLPYLDLDQGQILLFIRDYAPESVAILIENTLSEILKNRNGGMLSIGALATIWSASKGMNALTKALNLSYATEEKRSFFIARSMSIVFTMMLIAVIVVALVLPVFGQQIGVFVFSYLGFKVGFLTLWNNLRWVIAPVLIFIVFSVIYWIVPDLKIQLKSVFPGAAFATVGWVLTSLAFSFYVGSYGNYANMYGSIGAIIILMIWLYFSAIILMLGGQMNAVMTERREAKLEKTKSNAII
jgi:membrane protein